MKSGKTSNSNGKPKAELQTLHAAREYKPYAQYKDSSVEWLGKIPQHWEIKRLKYLATVNDQTLSESTAVDTPITYVDIGGVDAADGIVSEEEYTFGNAPSRARRIVRCGDVIVSTVRTYLRAIASIPESESHVIVSTGFAVIRPVALDASFAAYALRAPYFVERVVANSFGVSYPAINASDMIAFPIAFPNLSEQRSISLFLDRETEKIDALIAKKERLIELLRERRTALITRIVAKGLNPDAPMKDSGVEWLGMIPKEWGIQRLKYVAPLKKTKFQAKPSYATYIGLEHVEPWTGKLIYKDQPENVESSVTPFSSGDIMFGKLRPYLAKAACPSFDGVCTSEILVFSTYKSHSPNYLKFCFLTSSYIEWLNSNTYGTKMPRVDSSELENSLMPTPPLEQQYMIVRFLDRETGKIDALIEKTREAIDRLKEFRIALISAAVTGKINVQGNPAQ